MASLWSIVQDNICAYRAQIKGGNIPPGPIETDSEAERRSAKITASSRKKSQKRARSPEAGKAEKNDKRVKTNGSKGTAKKLVVEKAMDNATTVNRLCPRVALVDLITDAISISACTKTNPISDVHRQSGPLFDVSAIPQKRVSARQLHFT